MVKWPGPASTVEERPLRKISSEGTAVRSPLKEASFQTRFIRNRFDGNPISDGFFQLTQPRSREAVAAVLYCMKGTRSLIKLAL